jgi:hypothetical protein
LSADMDAVGDALAMGVRTGSTMSHDKTSRGTAAAWQSVSNRIADYRSEKARQVEFMEEDRQQQASEQQRKNQS